jgi:peptide/nickel transport system substrate-binding protein
VSDRAHDNDMTIFGLNSALTRRTFIGFAAGAATAGLLAACGDDDDDDEDEAPAAAPDDDDVEEVEEEEDEIAEDDDEEDAADAPDPDDISPVGTRPDELVLCWGADQFGDFGLDPVRHSGRVAESMLRHIYEPLVRFEKDFATVVPALATEWERLDELTMQFKLREGVQFHNGEPFNAEAVRYSILRPLQEETRGNLAGSRYGTIEDVEIVDDYTINLITRFPDPVLIFRLAAGFHTNIMAPEWAAQGQEVVSREANGTGPYKLVSWRPNEDLVLEANPDYWDGPPEIERVRITVISETATRVAALRTGEVHIATDMPPEELPAIDESDRARVMTVDSNRSAFYWISVEAEPFDDPRVRQAINYAANVDGVIATVLAGMGTRLATTVPPFAFGFNPDLEPYPHDPDRARELLAEAGHPDGIDLQIWYFDGRIPKQREVAEAMCIEMQQANIRCTPEMRESALLTELMRNNETVGLAFGSWGNAFSDGLDSIEPLFGCAEWEARMDWTRPYGCNQELEELIVAAQQEVDEEARAQIIRDAQVVLYEDAAALFQYLVVDAYGVDNWVLWEPRPDQMIWAHEMRWNE